MLIRRKTMMSTVMHDINVIQTHTNLVSSRIVRYQPYTASVVCDEGYSIYEITIKMGGVDITSTAYDATYNMITIPSVTDDVDIECYAMHTMPSDYVRVDGIKNPSNAYLDTGYAVNNNNKVSIKFFSVRKSGTIDIASSKATGMSTTNGSGWWYNSSNGNFYIFYAKTSVYIGTFSDASTYECIADYYNGTHLRILNETNRRTDNIPKLTWSSYYHFCLFSRNQGYDSSYTAGQIIYHFKIYDYSTNAYVRYYISCLNDSGVAGFWDAARGVFQGSSNSTAFEAVGYSVKNMANMWDGYYNVSKTEHSEAETLRTWKDIVGDCDVTCTRQLSWTSKGWDGGTNKGLKAFRRESIPPALKGDAFTLECTFTPSTIMTSYFQVVASSYSVSETSNDVLYFGYKKVAMILLNGNGRTSGYQLLSNKEVISVGTMTTMAIRFNKSNKLCELFVNGVKVAEYTMPFTQLNLTKPFEIGASEYAGQGLMVGVYHCCRIYSRLLTDAELTYNYNIDVQRFGT